MNSKIIRDFAPSKDNNRNSEGAFITLKNGNIMFAYSRYGGEGDDDGAAADIYASVSVDGGESFGEMTLLETDDRSGYCYTAIHETEGGDILLAYCAGSVEDGCTLNRLRIRKITR